MSELGSGSGTSYPASLDVDNSVEVDSSTTARADVPNDLAAAIIAVQNELGTDPAGSLTNVKTFLQTEHSTNGTHGDLTVGSLTLSKSLRLKQGADVASASDLAIDIDGNLFDVTGTTTINTMRTKGIGTSVVLQFDGACQLTYDATNFFIPGKANYTTAAGDVFMFYEYASADWRCTGYALASGKAIFVGTVATATATSEGVVELATAAEVATGTDTVRSITPATLDGFVNGKTDTTITASDSIVFADATDSNAAKKDTVQGIIDLLGAGVISQGDLKTTTQDNVSAAVNVINTLIHSGGEYVLGRQYKATSTISGFTAVFSDGERHFHTTSDVGGTNSSGMALTTSFTTAQTMFAWAHTSGGSPTITARSRYIQASPPYDIGDGHIHTFIYLLVENGSGKILQSLHAPDPTWANNGPTDIRPEYKKNGKLYRNIKRFDKTKEYSDPDCVTTTLEEITLDYKNSDMDLLPHPYVGNNMEGQSVVLIDPCSDIALRIEELKEVGETPLMDLLMENDYVRFGNEHISGRCTPCNQGLNEVMVVKPTWKNSK